MIKSIYSSQDEIFAAIMTLYCPVFECDITYGNGRFYKNIDRPRLCFDLEPLFDYVTAADSKKLPIDSETLNNIVCDLPFLTYIRKNRTGNGKMVMSNRFSGYWKYEELENDYKLTLKECFRALKKNGKLIFKCQDIIHNHSLHCTHNNVINWAAELGFDLLDLFVLSANHRMPFPNRAGKQKHARIYHSYFLIFEKK